jgi:hypothetical protein
MNALTALKAYFGARATFLIDGFVAGVWKIERSKRTAALVIEPFVSLSRADRDALASEGERLLRFVEDEAETLDLHFVDPA